MKQRRMLKLPLSQRAIRTGTLHRCRIQRNPRIRKDCPARRDYQKPPVRPEPEVLDHHPRTAESIRQRSSKKGNRPARRKTARRLNRNTRHLRGTQDRITKKNAFAHPKSESFPESQK